jgi:hypothetical protein
MKLSGKVMSVTGSRREDAMSKIIVYRRPNQDCWYIKTSLDMDGLICYKSREKAAAVALRHHPYSNIYIED